MECYEQTAQKMQDLSGAEQALFNGVNDGIITKAQYKMFLGTLEKRYGRMLSRSDIGKKRK